MRLKVKWFDAMKGFGFLARETGADVFVHYKHIVGKGRRDLAEGQVVECDVVDGPKGPQAQNVRILDTGVPS